MAVSPPTRIATNPTTTGSPGPTSSLTLQPEIRAWVAWRLLSPSPHARTKERPSYFCKLPGQSPPILHHFTYENHHRFLQLAGERSSLCILGIPSPVYFGSPISTTLSAHSSSSFGTFSPLGFLGFPILLISLYIFRGFLHLSSYESEPLDDLTTLMTTDT